MRQFLMMWLAIFVSMGASAAIIDFESDNSFLLGSESIAYAGDIGGIFTSGQGEFHGYHYTNPWDYWGGFVASNRTITAANDIYHQFTSAPGADHTIGSGGTYAIGFDDWESGVGCLIGFSETQNVVGAWFANNKWTSEYIAQNYAEDDYYCLIVTGYNAGMQSIGNITIDMTNAADWSYFTLDFQNAHALGFKMESSDAWTPFYFCMDDIKTTQVPEPLIGPAVLFGVVVIIGRRRKLK